MPTHRSRSLRKGIRLLLALGSGAPTHTRHCSRVVRRSVLRDQLCYRPPQVNWPTGSNPRKPEMPRLELLVFEDEPQQITPHTRALVSRPLPKLFMHILGKIFDLKVAHRDEFSIPMVLKSSLRTHLYETGCGEVLVEG